MKKAFAWLAEHGVAYDFTDYQRAGVSDDLLFDWNRRIGWRLLLNTRGTTWKRLGEEERAEMDETRALTLMARHPSLIRRPLLDTGNALLIGFDAARYATEFAGAGE
ncbi:MAG: Spx/MgsR family RNA polymerase-binding regulatory protein [Candidatus Accumulibacter sp.]|nr:Spx/MgsR family RNA polymerase-binding regulatory protein [Accumulibacter sp.]